MKHLIGFIGILFSLSTFGNAPSFPEVAAGPWSQDQKVNIASAVIRIILNAEDTNHCSATFIDNQGTALTALHCLRNCLLTNQNWNSAREGFPPVDITLIPDQVPKSIFCPEISVSGHPEWNNPQVLHTGWGLISYTDRFVNTFPQLLAELKGKGYSAKDGDFAILKFKTIGNSCLKLAKQKSTDLWLVGFPMIKDLAPTTHKISSGKAYASAKEAQFYVKNAGPAFDALYDRPGVILSSAPNQFGFSGSPSLDAHGKILALNSALMVSTKKVDGQDVEIRETQSIEMDFILKILRAQGFNEPVCNQTGN